MESLRAVLHCRPQSSPELRDLDSFLAWWGRAHLWWPRSRPECVGPGQVICIDFCAVPRVVQSVFFSCDLFCAVLCWTGLFTEGGMESHRASVGFCSFFGCTGLGSSHLISRVLSRSCVLQPVGSVGCSYRRYIIFVANSNTRSRTNSNTQTHEDYSSSVLSRPQLEVLRHSGPMDVQVPRR